MISSGRFGYHLDDIAEIKAKTQPLDPLDAMRLSNMDAEVKEYTAANPDDAAAQIEAKAKAKAAA
jgi:hypothetical protein